MNDEQVERVAKAIAEWFACPWPFLLDAQREGYRSEARVAIAAMQPDIPEDAEVVRDLDSGVVSFEMYAANGRCCGGAEFHPSGKVVWTLIQGDRVKSGTYEENTDER